MTIPEKRRPRRIASDEAHAWARNLRLGNLHAKFLLCTLTFYINGEGMCFVSPATLAEDCEMGVNTVRRRLSWLEEIGALARSPQWIDDRGRRNSDGRGRRTTDEIRLMLDIDQDEIERRAEGEERSSEEEEPAGDEGTSDLPSEGRSPDVQEISSPPVAYPQPTHCGVGLTSEPEPEPEKESKSPTPTPSKREGALKDQPQVSEASEQRFREFKAAYPDGIVDLDKAQREFLSLADADQAACVTAAPVYAARCRKRREKSKKAHLFIRERAWIGLLAASDTKSAATFQYPVEGSAGRALLKLARIARYSPLIINGNVVLTAPVTKQILALADAPPEDEWGAHDRGSGNFASWRDLGFSVWPSRGFAYQRIEAPWPWPPRKDGSIVTGTTCPPGELSDADARALTVT